jgi:hypothetical protein
MLSRFLKLEGASSLRESRTEIVLRAVRSIAGIEAWMIVLATAEVIARSYYAALRDVTESALLRELCETMLKEEAAHLGFRRFALKKFRDGRSSLNRAIMKGAHRGFLLTAVTLVWLRHHAIFRTSSRTLKRLAEETGKELDALYV